VSVYVWRERNVKVSIQWRSSFSSFSLQWSHLFADRPLHCFGFKNGKNSPTLDQASSFQINFFQVISIFLSSSFLCVVEVQMTRLLKTPSSLSIQGPSLFF